MQFNNLFGEIICGINKILTKELGIQVIDCMILLKSMNILIISIVILNKNLYKSI